MLRQAADRCVHAGSEFRVLQTISSPRLCSTEQRIPLIHLHHRTMDLFSSAAASQGGHQTLARLNSNERSPSIPGASQHTAIFSSCRTSFDDDLLSFLSYIKSRQIPIFSAALPDVRSVLGRGASFFVNGAEMPETCIDDITGEVFHKGSVVALKRAVVPPGTKSIQEGLTRRIHLLFNEVLTMKHPPLAAHPNIVQLLGIGFEVEGHETDQNVVPVLIPECAELGNLAEVLETAKREGRPLGFEQKLGFCVDIAHGLEALHACGRTRPNPPRNATKHTS